MKVIGILGTTNKIGLTAQMLDEVLLGAKENGCETMCLYLGDQDLKGNNLRQIGQEIEQADCLIFATPTYWNGMSGLLKNFFDVYRNQFVLTSSKAQLIPYRLKGKSYITITSCYKGSFENIVAGVTNTTFNQIDDITRQAGMHRMAELVLTNTFRKKELSKKKKEEAYTLGVKIAKRQKRGGFTLKRYIQLFFMLAITTLIVMGAQVGLEKLGGFKLESFWMRYMTFVILFFLFLSVMLRTVTLYNHKRR
ncbi:flavodoxin family protein [Listeria sp. PSOL-1]|uniref:flavodoxin family protein n=1 Tax=Listeria sp. PSOL-1 TaxID=1844999 RepID=UPI0013D110AF|nr:flavodoxin family protein [Listeria sp. PSOL-1]